MTELGVDVNVKDAVCRTTFNNKLCAEKTWQELIYLGSNVDTTDHDGCTLLMRLAYLRHNK